MLIALARLAHLRILAELLRLHTQTMAKNTSLRCRGEVTILLDWNEPECVALVQLGWSLVHLLWTIVAKIVADLSTEHAITLTLLQLTLLVCKSAKFLKNRVLRGCNSFATLAHQLTRMRQHWHARPDAELLRFVGRSNRSRLTHGRAWHHQTGLLLLLEWGKLGL